MALRFLAPRPRSEAEIRRRLRRAGAEPAAIEPVLAQLRTHQLVDDAAFAQYWVDQRQTFKPRGARLVRAELRQLGVAAGVAQRSAETLAPDAADDAYRAASKRAQQVALGLPRGDDGEPDERAFKARLSQFLARRGFDWDTISTVVGRLWLELNRS